MVILDLLDPLIVFTATRRYRQFPRLIPRPSPSCHYATLFNSLRHERSPYTRPKHDIYIPQKHRRRETSFVGFDSSPLVSILPESNCENG